MQETGNGLKKLFRDFAQYIITGMYKYIAGQRLNSPMTGACTWTKCKKQAIDSKNFQIQDT